MKSYLISTGNDGYRHRYEFKKQSSFKNIFIKFMEDLGFNAEKDLYFFINTYESVKGGEDITVNRDITKSRDSIENYKNKDFDVDLVYFEQSIVMIVRTKNHNKLVKSVDKHFKFYGE